MLADAYSPPLSPTYPIRDDGIKPASSGDEGPSSSSPPCTNTSVPRERGTIAAAAAAALVRRIAWPVPPSGCLQAHWSAKTRRPLKRVRLGGARTAPDTRGHASCPGHRDRTLKQVTTTHRPQREYGGSGSHHKRKVVYLRVPRTVHPIGLYVHAIHAHSMQCGSPGSTTPSSCTHSHLMPELAADMHPHITHSPRLRHSRRRK